MQNLHGDTTARAFRIPKIRLACLCDFGVFYVLGKFDVLNFGERAMDFIGTDGHTLEALQQMQDNVFDDITPTAVAPDAATAAAIVTLTDSSGYDGTHDNTIAAMAALVTLTDSTGDSGSHNDTVADGSTIGAALTDSSGGTPGDTIAAIAAAGTYADDDNAIRDALSSLAAKINTLRTDNIVQNQNDSDLAQKIIELVAREVVHAQNISDLTQKVIEFETQNDALLADNASMRTQITALVADVLAIKNAING